MSKCTIEALRQSINFGSKITKTPGGEEYLRVAYISALKAMYAQKSPGSPEYIGKLIEAGLSIPFRALRQLGDKDSVEAIQAYIEEKSFPEEIVQANFKKLGIPNYEAIVEWIKVDAIGTLTTINHEGTRLQKEIVVAKDTDIAHNLVDGTEVIKELSVKDAKNDMSSKKASLLELVEDLKNDSPDKWTALLQTYFPSSNKLGAEFTEWARESFFDMFVDFTGSNQGFVKNIDVKISEFKEDLESTKDDLASVEYGKDNIEFLNKLLADVNLTGVKKKYFTAVLINDFDFILDNLIKIVGQDTAQTERYNDWVEGFEEGHTKVEPLLLDISGRKLAHLFEKVEDVKGRYALKPEVNPIIEKLSTTSHEFLSNKDLATSTFYHILGNNDYYFRNRGGENILLNPKRFYSYSASSNRNTSSIDHDVNPLDNSTKFINNIMPLLKIIGSDGNVGRRMTVADFVALSPLLVNVAPTMDALANKLKELGDGDSTKIGAIARSLHSYIFSVRATHNGKFHSIRSAGRKDRYKGLNGDIVNSMFSALISKSHVQYLKVEEGRVTTTKGPNEGTESQIIDEALAGVLMDINRYTKSGITKNIQVTNGTVFVDIGGGTKVDISKVTSIEPDGNSRGMRRVAMNIGLEDLFNNIDNTYKNIVGTAQVDDAVVSTFRSIIEIAATNSRDHKNRLALSHTIEKSTERVATHKDYMFLSPSTIIKEDDQRNLAEVFFVDSSKAQRIGDKTTQSSTTPNKNTTIKRQVSTFKKFNDNKVTPTDMSHIPMLIDEQQEGSDIVPAEVGDVFIKAPIVYDGNVVKLADWDLKIRLEHAMLEGFLNAPRKNVGKEFFLQVVNYSDKSSPELFSITTQKNLLLPGAKASNELKNAYIEYNYKKNEAIQRVMLVSFQEFIVGEYEYVRRSIIEDAEFLGVDSEPRVTALRELKELLLSTDFNAQTGDMLKPFNAKLDKVRINPRIIEESNADLDKDADFITFKDNEAAFLKPTAGIRAELYRDPKTADKLLNHYLTESRLLLKSATARKGSLESYNINIKGKSGLRAVLESKPNITSNVDDFIDRFFLINGIYGHSLKTLTMGDETYFEGRFSSDTQGDFYAQAKKDLTSKNNRVVEMAGLEGVETMIKNQFKRAQSVLSRGVVYAQQETLIGLKKNSNRDNLLQHLEIYKGKKDDGGDIYRFKALEGKTLTELWGKGVISPIIGTKTLSARNAAGDILVKFNIGTQQVIVSTDLNDMMRLRSENLPIELIEGIQDLLENRLSVEDSAVDPAQTLADSTLDVSKLKPSIEKYRDVSLTMTDIKEHYLELEENKWDAIVQPDYLPSMLISDPESYINLLNKMDVGQETADGIQYIHPLYYAMKRQARGGSIGAFNTKDYNAQKTLNTSVEYGKNRQVLQKNSGQMPFSMAQMSKVGGIELFNAFKTMNTAIEFKQNKFSYRRMVGNVMEDDADLARKKMYNIDDLFTYFEGYGSQGDKAWDRVLDVLRQNPIDLYSFVGHLNVPSNQKTGRKKITPFENVFTKNKVRVGVIPGNRYENGDKIRGVKPRERDFMSTPNVQIDYISNEFNFEILTKEHSYDVSGKLNKRSSLSLLSQLVNAVAFGGLSNINAMSLQNAMGGRMRINRLRVGRDLAIVARGMSEKEPKYPGSDYRALIAKLEKGNVSTKGYTEQQITLYEEVMRAGVYSMAQLAFNESADSMLIKKIIKGEGYSLDTPAIQNKVMGTLRAAFFGDTVKMKMDGFQAVVSATHKTITVFDFNGGRKSRGAYIQAGLEAGMNHDWNKETGAIVHINIADADTLGDVEDYVLPFDKVKVVTTIETEGAKRRQVETYYTRSNIKLNDYIGKAPSITTDKDGIITTVTEDLYAILTPDAGYDDTSIDNMEEYNSRGDNDLINVSTGLNGSDSYYKWFLDEQYAEDPGALETLVLNGKITENITEKHSLRWYEITRKDENGDTIDIKDSEAFQGYYRAVMIAKTEDRSLDEKESAKYRAALILETQRKGIDGKAVWDLKPAEIVLPAYMKDRFGLPNEISLHELLGHSSSDGEQRIHLKEKLKAITPRGKRFARITEGTKHYSKMITRIYTGRAMTESSPWYDGIVNQLLTVEKAHIRDTVAANPGMDPHDVELSKASMIYINKKKEDAFDQHVTQLADSFMDMLETVSTRIPGQSKQSGFMARVVEFLDAQGNAAFAPTEHLVTTGGDFDIDTLSILTRTMDADGKIYKDDDFRNPKTEVFEFDLLDKAYDEEIKKTSRSIKTYIKTYNKEANDYVIKLNGDIARAKAEGAPTNVLEGRLVHAKSNNIDEKKSVEITDELINRIHKKYENILANVIANSVMGSLNNVDTAVELNTPISMSMFKPIQARIKKAFGDPIELGMNGETFWPITKYEELAAQGKEAIGMFATALKINSAVQAAQMNYKQKYAAHAKATEADPFIFDHSISFSRKNAEGKKESVTKHRKSFADLDRFNITKNIAGSRNLQEKLDSLKRGEQQYTDEALPTLIGMIEEEVGTKKAAFTFEEKTSLLAEFSEDAGTNTFDEKFLLYLREQIVGKKIIDNDFLRKVGTALGQTFEEVSNSITVFSGKVKKSLIRPTKKSIAAFNGTLESIFGIAVPAEIADSNTPILKLKAYLADNVDVVETAFLNVIGKQLSNDVQSQFLSAATDNAKALILGKIRSSSLTNPLITTMMILGYDVDDIIDFLYDESIEGILIHFAREKGTLRRVSITSGGVSKLGDFGGPSKESLISMLKIGEQITRFRDVRSLNENAKIEQASLDKILQNLEVGKANAHTLYTAIIDNNYKLLEIGTNAPSEVKVFNPLQMVFLHPQSRDLFMNLYESEVYKMAALFRTVIEVREQAGEKGRDPLIYKSIKTALAALKVEAFLKETVSVEVDGQMKESHRLGEIMYQKDGKFDTDNIVRVRLDDPVNREEFIHNFPTYLEYAKTRIKGNTGLESLSFTNTFRSTTSILAIPKLKGTNVDNADAALIYDGFRELKTTSELEQDKELNLFKTRLYNNLSYYALIVSKGEVVKGSMIEVFDEINFELGTFLSTLSQKYYADNFRPTDTAVAEIMKGDVSTNTTLIAEMEGRNIKSDGYNRDYDESENDGEGEREDSYENDYIEPQDDDRDNEVGGRRRKTISYSPDSEALTLQIGTPANQGKVYRLVDPKLRGALFYAPNINDIAYRLFDVVADEALPHSTKKTFNKHASLPFIDELGKAGKQLGYKVKWKGEDAWILNYAGTSTTNGVVLEYEVYDVQSKDASYRVPGVHLMEQNPDLFLKGNIIEAKSSKNIRSFNFYKDQISAIAHHIPESVGKNEFIFKLDSRARALFSQQNLVGDPIVKAEARLIFNQAGAVIKTAVKNGLTRTTPSFDAFMSQDVVPKSNPLVRNVLVPSLKILINQQGSTTEEQAIIPEMKSQIAESINSLKTGHTMSFYGLRDDKQLEYQKAHFKMAAGIDIVENFVSSFMDKTKKGVVKNTLMNGAFRVKRVVVEGTGAYEYRVTRLAKGRFVTLVEDSTGKKIPVSMWIDPTTGGIKTNASGNTGKIAHYKAVDKGYSKATHTKYKIKVGKITHDAMVIHYQKPETVIKVTREGYNDEYYEVKPETAKNKGFHKKYLAYFADTSTLASINNQIAKSNATPTNLKCN